MDAIKRRIRTIPDFPKPGIQFRDITTLLKDKEGLTLVIDAFQQRLRGKPVDAIAGIESRGFILGGALAAALRVGFVPVRKKGKLPGKTVSISYDLEYGKDTLEIHADAIVKGERVVVVDDLIATGGTMLATCELLERIGGTVIDCLAVVDLPELGGSRKLSRYPLHWLCSFEGH